MPRIRHTRRRRHRGGEGEMGMSPTADYSAPAPAPSPAPVPAPEPYQAPPSAAEPSTYEKTKSKISNMFGSWWPSSGGRRTRHKRGGTGSRWDSSSHPLYLNPSSNSSGENIYNLPKGGRRSKRRGSRSRKSKRRGSRRR